MLSPSCAECAVGKYAGSGNGGEGSTGATECVDCETGKTTERTGSASSALCVCAPGYYASSDTCYACESGKYSDVINSEQCLVCAAGTYASGKCTEEFVEICTKKGDGSPAESCDDLVERHGPTFPYLKDTCCLCKLSLSDES